MASSNIPLHVGIILDGNRRWAKSKGLTTLEGHRRGAEVFREISLAAFDIGVQYLSAYIFSKENWKRTEEEVSYLMKLLLRAVEKYLDEFHKRNIKIVIIGRRDKLSRDIVSAIEKTEAKTKSNNGGCLVLCLNYSGQEEIVDAIHELVAAGEEIKAVSSEMIEQHLYAPDIPVLDLLIRTSGEQRTSGFMLWRAAYAELLFSNTLWPDYTIEKFEEALQEYALRQRRFGG